MCQPLSLFDNKRYALNPVIYKEAVLVICQEEMVWEVFPARLP